MPQRSRFPREAWVPLLAGLFWLWNSPEHGLVGFLFSVIPGCLLVGSGVSMLRPRFVEKQPPCAANCPNHNAVRRMLMTISTAQDCQESYDDCHAAADEAHAACLASLRKIAEECHADCDSYLEGCLADCEALPIREETWGRIKARYR